MLKWINPPWEGPEDSSVTKAIRDVLVRKL